jgi:hypothetical protein
VHPYGGIDKVVAFRQLYRRPTGVEIGTDVDNNSQACLSRPSDDQLPIAVKPMEIQVGMGVNQVHFLR